MQEKTVSESLGRAVQVRRAELGMKRPELAKRSGLSYPYVSEIENGMKSPSASALEKLATALELSMAELVGRAEDGRAASAGQGLSAVVDPRTPASRSQVIDLAAPAAPHTPLESMETPEAGGTNYDRSLEGLIAAVVRAEMAAWARRELPGLVRAEIELASSESDA